MAKKRKGLGVNEPLLFPDHPRPVTRRDFLRQGLISGLGMVAGGGILSLFADPRAAQATLSSDLRTLAGNANCGLGVLGTNIPFICFDLGGGANFAGSNVLTGQAGGQLDLLSTQGYSKLGLPGDMIPGLTETTTVFTTGGLGNYINTTLGLAFHSDSALLAGIQGSLDPARGANIHGAVIPARSENDTGNNPHNPMYAIATSGPGADPLWAGSEGSIVTLVGSQSSDSGGRSMAPDYMIDPTKRPTKIDRPSDVTGLVDTGKLVGLLSAEDATAVLESVSRLSDAKLGNVSTGLTRDAVIKDLVRCGYIGAADIADRFGD
ncbi:MAG: general secretion pathway protein GspF, partial [Chromatiales bacterium]